MKIIIIILVFCVGAYGVDRFLLWLESKGLLYYRRKKPPGGVVGSALLELHRFLNPSISHVIAVKEDKIKKCDIKLNEEPVIDDILVRHLVASQFPQWKDLPIRPVKVSGWDNRTFHLGEHMLVRMPSAQDYAAQVQKEHTWLPKLAPCLPLLIPLPLAMGEPANDYPWNWSIYRWIEGNSAAFAPIADIKDFAVKLAQFLIALQSIDPTNGPFAGFHSFYHGGKLITYDAEMRRAIAALNGKIDSAAVTAVWESALATTWPNSPVWVHGDISAGNLLVKDGRLAAVIDFGQLAIGDPACDLTIAWTSFQGESREAFHAMFSFDADTWARARGWTLWKALIVAAGFTQVNNNIEAAQCWRILDEVLVDPIVH